MYTNDDDEKSNADHNVTRKSLSTVAFWNNSGNQNVRPLALRSTQSFTGAIEELRLCNNFQHLNVNNCLNEALPPRLSTICPCGCLTRSSLLGPFRTRERNTLALHVVSPDVLNYHGYNFEPSQIAMFWKKDCRMFLWKGRPNKAKASLGTK